MLTNDLQAKMACTNCRKSHRKCDKSSPCGECKRRGLENCVYLEPKKRGPKHKRGTEDKSMVTDSFVQQDVKKKKSNNMEERQHSSASSSNQPLLPINTRTRINSDTNHKTEQCEERIPPIHNGFNFPSLQQMSSHPISNVMPKMNILPPICSFMNPNESTPPYVPTPLKPNVEEERLLRLSKYVNITDIRDNSIVFFIRFFNSNLLPLLERQFFLNGQARELVNSFINLESQSYNEFYFQIIECFIWKYFNELTLDNLEKLKTLYFKNILSLELLNVEEKFNFLVYNLFLSVLDDKNNELVLNCSKSVLVQLENDPSYLELKKFHFLLNVIQQFKLFKEQKVEFEIFLFSILKYVFLEISSVLNFNLFLQQIGFNILNFVNIDNFTPRNKNEFILILQHLIPKLQNIPILKTIANGTYFLLENNELIYQEFLQNYAYLVNQGNNDFLLLGILLDFISRHKVEMNSYFSRWLNKFGWLWNHLFINGRYQ
ncbi:hypothetical protein ABK040_012945 [Willaertia magna]